MTEEYKTTRNKRGKTLHGFIKREAAACSKMKPKYTPEEIDKIAERYAEQEAYEAIRNGEIQ